jgi:hypothetical protein
MIGGWYMAAQLLLFLLDMTVAGILVIGGLNVFSSRSPYLGALTIVSAVLPIVFMVGNIRRVRRLQTIHAWVYLVLAIALAGSAVVVGILTPVVIIGVVLAAGAALQFLTVAKKPTEAR